MREPTRPGKPVVGVILPQKTTGAELKALASFKTLLAISAPGPFSDATAKEIAARKTLLQLIVSDAKVLTDAGLKELVALTNPKQLGRNSRRRFRSARS